MEKRFVDKPWLGWRVVVLVVVAGVSAMMVVCGRAAPVGAFKFPLRTLLIYIIKPRRVH
jgi:hypothetical protein